MDMTKCKKGDKLISSHGNIYKYIKRKELGYNGFFPHEILSIKTGIDESVTDKGFIHVFDRRVEDDDIIDFIPKKDNDNNTITNAIEKIKKDIQNNDMQFILKILKKYYNIE